MTGGRAVDPAEPGPDPGDPGGHRGVPDPDVEARAVDREAHLVMRRVARTFDLATRFLPAERRRDVRRLYLVLRTLDDLVDDGRPEVEESLTEVEAWARGGAPAGRLSAILDDLAARYPSLPRDAVLDFTAGMRTDMAGPRIRDDADLDRYCYQVAGTVGRLMTGLLGVRAGHEGEADTAARALGMAMQRTNILRDIPEDARAGRIYLPDTDLAGLGLPSEDPDPPSRGTSGSRSEGTGGSTRAAVLLERLEELDAAGRAALTAGQVARAEADFELGLQGIGHLRRGRWAITAGALMYREILHQIERDAYGIRRERSVVSRGRKVAVILRAWLRAL